jgi:hypothetical protein
LVFVLGLMTVSITVESVQSFIPFWSKVLETPEAVADPEAVARFFFQAVVVKLSSSRSVNVLLVRAQ